MNEMTTRKKRSLCFQCFMSGFYKINVAVSRPTEFNLEQNFAHIGKVSHLVPQDQNSTPMFISAESFPFLLEIFFVKDCIGEMTRFVAAVK